eukprot:c16241_g2_i1 orf=77-295(+)
MACKHVLLALLLVSCVVTACRGDAVRRRGKEAHVTPQQFGGSGFQVCQFGRCRGAPLICPVFCPGRPVGGGG